MKQLVFTLIFIVILASSINAAIIKGSIYDLELNPVQNAVVTINTVPQQVIVSKDGFYELTVPEGNYNLKAEYQDSKDEQDIKITEDSTYNIDLILFPSTQDEEELYNSTDLDLSNLDLNKKNYIDYIIYGIILILLIILIITFVKRKPKQIETKKEEFITDDSEKVLNYLKKEQRATQKDIRKLLNLSEAKVSLIITELESKGKIKKIRKGRANIIILNQR